MITIETRFRGGKELIRGLDAVRKLIRHGSATMIGRRLGRDGVRIVRQLTPRQKSANRAPWSKRGHKPFHSEWDLIEQTIRHGAYKAIIRHNATRGGVTSAGFRALWAVEFGARKHEIVARDGGMMIWRDAQRLFRGRRMGRRGEIGYEYDAGLSGGVAVARHVKKHPGNKPFRMVHETRVHLVRVRDRLLVNYMAQVQRAFGQGLSITAS